MQEHKIDFSNISRKIEQCCRTTEECGRCNKSKCLIGFSKAVNKFVQMKNIYNIENGAQMIPRIDLKVYDEDALKEALLEILMQCQNCRDNHDEDCVVNLVRSALELALIGEAIEYKGNVLTYIMDLSKINQDKGREIMELYKKRK